MPIPVSETENWRMAWIVPSGSESLLSSGAYLYAEGISRKAREENKDVRAYLEETSTPVARYWDSYGLVTIHRQQELVVRLPFLEREHALHVGGRGRGEAAKRDRLHGGLRAFDDRDGDAVLGIWKRLLQF